MLCDCNSDRFNTFVQLNRFGSIGLYYGMVNIVSYNDSYISIDQSAVYYTLVTATIIHIESIKRNEQFRYSKLSFELNFWRPFCKWRPQWRLLMFTVATIELPVTCNQ